MMEGRQRDPLSEATGDRWAGDLVGLVDRLGGHPTGELDLDLSVAPDDVVLTRWLLVACLLQGRSGPAAAMAGYRGLESAGMLDPAAIGSVERSRLAALLEAAGLPQAEARAALLARVASGICQLPGHSLGALMAACDDLEDLARRLAGLAQGLGPATLARYLRPLREHFPAAHELPLDPGAHAAAAHFGWADESDEPAGALAAVRSLVDRAGSPPGMIDVEAALERIGRRACLRGRISRCPLGSDCPLSGAAGVRDA